MTRWGVLLPTFDPHRTGGALPTLEAARLAEAAGFDAVWAGDHLACPAPVLDAPTCLAAAAAVTERVELGIAVLQLGLRQPAWAAKQLATLDALSGGRLALGVGVGGEFPEEFAAAGVTHRDRGARLDELLGVLPDLLTGRPVHHSGPALQLDVPALEPAMPAPPRLSLGVVELWTAFGAEDAVAEQLAAQLAAGVTELVLMPYGTDQLEQIERFAGVRDRLAAAVPSLDRGARR